MEFEKACYTLKWTDKLLALTRRPDELYENIYQSLLKTGDFKFIRGEVPGKFGMAVCAEVPLKSWEMDLVNNPNELFLYLVRRFSECPIGKTYPTVTYDDISKFCGLDKITVTVYFNVSTTYPDMERLIGIQ